MNNKTETIKIKLLADKIIKSDKKAFDSLFNLLKEEMFIFAKSILMDESKAKDVVQEVWISYWERRKKIENKNIKAYLFKLVRNRVYKTLREVKFNKVQLDTIKDLKLTAVQPCTEEKYDLEATHQKIEKSIKKLPKRCKEVFELSRFSGLKNQEIALCLGISKRSVENQLSIALRKIKLSLQK